MKCHVTKCDKEAQYRENEVSSYCFDCFFKIAEVVFKEWHMLWIGGYPIPHGLVPMVFDRDKIIKG